MALRQRRKMMTIDAVVFDMDGVLVNSEPLWHEAEIEVAASLGFVLSIAECQQTTGVRVDGVVRHWRSQRPHAFAGVTDQEVIRRIVAGVVERVERQGAPMLGAVEAVVDAADRGFGVGLASSSPFVIIDAALRRLQVRDLFGVVCSAEHLPKGKPDPAVYLEACGGLGVDPKRAVAVEDSSSGILAGKNAGMFVVAVADAAAAPPAALDVADVVITSLRELPALLQQLQLSSRAR